MGTSRGIEELFEEFHRRKRAAWRAGLAEYGRSANEPFRGDAAQEAAAEVVDFSNYVDQLALEGRISEEERGEIEADTLSKYVWLDSVQGRTSA
jgi:hypothetical protein